MSQASSFFSQFSSFGNEDGVEEEFSDEEEYSQDMKVVNIIYNGDDQHVVENIDEMKNYSQDDWVDFFESLKQTEINDNSEAKDVVECMKRLYYTYCMGIDNDWAELGKRFQHLYQGENLNRDSMVRVALVSIYEYMTNNNLFDVSNPVTKQLYKEYNLILVSMNAVRELFAAQKIISAPEDEYRLMNIFKCFPLMAMEEASIDLSTCKPQTKLLYFFLAKLKHLNIRIRKDTKTLYKPHLDEENHFLFHYEKYTKVDEFCNRALFPNVFHQEWVKITFDNPAALSACVNQLEDRLLDNLPHLTTNQDLYAFKNGLYHSGYDRFYHFPFYTQSENFDAKWDWTVDDLPATENVTACSYIDEEFPWHIYREKLLEEGRYQEYYEADIGETGLICDLEYIRPIVVKIFNCQHYDFNSIYFTFAMIGRLFFTAHQYDSWQSIVTNYGLAGTGKSLIAQFLIFVLGIENIGILANNAQKDFGLYTMVDKRLILGLDLDERLTIDRATFNSMVSNEPMTVNVKQKAAEQIKMWKSHIMMCCNVLRANDQGGSWQRREILIPFLHKIKDDEKDFDLLNKMKRQTGFIVKVFISCYHHLRHRVGTGFVKNFRSRLLVELENRVYREFDPVRAFIAEKCEIFEKRPNDNPSDMKQDLQDEENAYDYTIQNDGERSGDEDLMSLRDVNDESISMFTVSEKTLRRQYNTFVQSLPNVRQSCKFSIDFVKNYGDYIRSCNPNQYEDITQYTSKYMIGIRMIEN